MKKIIFKAALKARVFKLSGEVADLGIVCTRLITTAGVNFLCDAFQGLATISDMKYHGSGTGTTAEAIGDTTLVTEVESRATGSQAEGAGANIYKTVGTIAYTASRAITEHGLFSSAGSLWDRSVFTAINVVNGESIEFTHETTFTAGG